jgi:hypothetical protein
MGNFKFGIEFLLNAINKKAPEISGALKII